MRVVTKPAPPGFQTFVAETGDVLSQCLPETGAYVLVLIDTESGTAGFSTNMTTRSMAEVFRTWLKRYEETLS